MTNKEAINMLKIAAPIKALTQKEFEKFIRSVNMAIEALEKQNQRENMQEIKTNRDYIIAALQDEFDDGGSTEEGVIYNNIACPYIEGDKRCECEKPGKDIGWETCTECKTKWLDSETEEEA